MALDAGLTFRRSKQTDGQLPTATVHKILRNRAYTGEFDWKGKTYRGSYTPLVTRELWDRVQAVLDRRHEKRHRKVKHDFAFSGLIACGHCGCALVGEIKKGRYVYYHCTGYKGKCPEPYTREEVLSAQFADVLKGLTFDDEILGWVKEALRESHGDEKRFHEEAIVRLQDESHRLQNRLDAMYVDKLDGRIDEAFYDRKAGEWRSEQDRLLRSVEEHQAANRTYLDEGVALLELAGRAYELFRKQEPREQRRLLDFLLSNCTWKDNQLAVTYRQPFDLIADASKNLKRETAAGGDTDDRRLVMGGRRDSNPRYPDPQSGALTARPHPPSSAEDLR